MTKSIFSGVPIPIVSHAFIKNVSSCFDWIILTGTLEILFGEKS